jgi:hypothetical protein
VTQGRLFIEGLSQGRCKLCGARIYWGQNHNGRWQPIDPLPEPTMGNLDLVDDDGQLVFSWLPEDVAEVVRGRGEPLYVDHRDVCEMVEHPDPDDDDQPF